MEDTQTGDDGENIVVVLGDTENTAAGNEAPAAGNAAVGDHGFDDLKQQLAEEQASRQRAERQAEAERQQRIAAQREAQESRGKATEYEASAFSAQYDSVVNALGLAQQEADKLASEQEAAMSEGDFKKATELNVKIGRQAARIVQLEDGKAALDAQRQARAAEPAPKPQAQQRSEAEQREAYLATQSPKTAAWMRAHPAYFDDIKLQNKVLAGHYLAVDKGIVPESDEYFQFVEEHAGLRQRPVQQETRSTAAVTVERPGADATERTTEARPQGRQPEQQQTQPQQPTGRIPSAAPSREAQPTTQNGRNGTRVTISAAEREHAIATALPDDPDPVATFAKHKAALIREGKWFGA